MSTTIEKIQRQIAENPILLYMKGSPKLPSCGFSAQAVQALAACGERFAYVDILQNPDIRAELPKYANWPTFPQLWVDGELVGGCDIVIEMYQRGELQQLIKETAAKYKGVPYKFGGTTPKGFDCSAYVQYVFGRHDAKLPRTADAQVLDGIFVLKSKLKPGDLVFFSTYASGASHVGIYAGSGKFWSASTSRGVVLDSLDTGYWKEHYYGARRVLIENGETA